MVPDPFSAIGSIASSFIQAKQSEKNIRHQAIHNRELADRQYGHQLDMWNKMNEYNAPIKQMARFKEAGLNPHLIYGKGGSPGNATTMPQYQEQTTDFSQRKAVDPGAMLANYHSLNLAKENAIIASENAKQAKVDTEILTDPYTVAYRKNMYKHAEAKSEADATTAGYQSAVKYWEKEQAQAYGQYNKEVAEQRFLQLREGVTKQQLDNAWQRMQMALWNRTEARGMSGDYMRWQQGWTDLMNGQWTPEARSMFMDAGKVGVDVAKGLGQAAFVAKGLKANQPKGKTVNTVNYDEKGKRIGSTRTRTAYK